MTDGLTLKARYFQDSNPEGVPCQKENFIRREVEMQLPVAQSALVLVDMWDHHFIDSWIERAASITTQFVVPAVAAARQAGIHIIHAPSPPVAVQYDQVETEAALMPPKSATASDWPPAEFRNREGDYAAFRPAQSTTRNRIALGSHQGRSWDYAGNRGEAR